MRLQAVSEKSNPFKGIPSLFSRSSKKQDEVMPSTSGFDGRQAEGNEPRLNADGRQLVADSKFFDASWYLKQNPDVAAAHIAPLEHYLNCGEKEGRNPGPDFDVVWYAKKYPEFAATGVGALEHYLRYGCLENKSPSLASYRKKLQDDPRLTDESNALKSAPVKCYTSPPLARRVNLVVDSMSFRKLDNKSDLVPSEAPDKGEGTVERGLTVAVLLALATGSSLRVVTRVAPAQVSGFKNFLLDKKLQIPAHVEFVHCDYVTAQTSLSTSLSTSRWDIFITVDAVNDASIRNSINERNIFALASSDKALAARGDDQRSASDDLSAVVSELTRSCESVFV